MPQRTAAAAGEGSQPDLGPRPDRRAGSHRSPWGT